MTDEGIFLQNEILAACKTPVSMDLIVKNVMDKLPRNNYQSEGYIRNSVWYLIDCGEIELNTDRLFVRTQNVSK